MRTLARLYNESPPSNLHLLTALSATKNTNIPLVVGSSEPYEMEMKFRLRGILFTASLQLYPDVAFVLLEEFAKRDAALMGSDM